MKGTAGPALWKPAAAGLPPAIPAVTLERQLSNILLFYRFIFSLFGFIYFES